MNKFRIKSVLGIILFLVFQACNSDDKAPNVEIVAFENTEYCNGEEIAIKVNFEDDSDINMASVHIIEPGQTTVELYSQSIVSDLLPNSWEGTYTLSSEIDGTIEIVVIAEDEHGNKVETSASVEYSGQRKGILNTTIRLLYDTEPLLMYQDYTYPMGHDISFSRVTFFISEAQGNNSNKSKSVHFVNMTDSHETLEGAQNGYLLKLDGIPYGEYNSLTFLAGINEELNAMLPADFESGHPLSNAAEHWFSWKSYIFVKVEGNVDTDGDGEKDTAFAFHLGADEAARAITINENFTVGENAPDNIDINIDLLNLIQGQNRIYPLLEAPQLHSLTQLDYVLELADNFQQSFID